jgi:serine/threonine protein kinase
MNNTTIGKYKITRLIGEGGMASVYEAEHEMLGTKVAIKVLNPILSANAQIRERFKNEARVMATLNHPNITRVIDFDEQPQHLCIVMEYLEGEDLSQKIKRNGALSDKHINEVFAQTLAAFQYAHDKGIVHRDIKPSNIFILPDGQVKILDFGIAKLFGQSNEMTQTGTQMGTPTYMSPEQVKADKTIDKRSDIYSLGVTLYYAVNGKAPYNSTTESQFDIFNKIVYETLPEITGNSKYNGIIKKACEKNREERFQHCNDWLSEMNNPSSAHAAATPVGDDKTVIANKVTEDATQVQQTVKNTTNTSTQPTNEQPRVDNTKQEPQHKVNPSSNTSSNLPQEKKSKTGLIIGIVGGVILLIIILVASSGPSEEEKIPNYELPEQNSAYLLVGDSTKVPSPTLIETPNFNGIQLNEESENNVVLSKVSSSPNEITDVDVWFNQNNLSLPTYKVYNEFMNEKGNVPEDVPNKINGLRITDGFSYIDGDIYFYGKNFGDKSVVIITDKDKHSVKHCLDFSNFSISPKTVKGDEDYVYQSVNWAVIENDVLYISHGHSTYAKSSFGQNAYISAIDLTNYKILWTTDPLTSNSTFSLIGNSIICGYGFTDEPDYLFVIDKKNGRRVQKINVSSGPEYIIPKNNQLFVRTYNNNYIFQID